MFFYDAYHVKKEYVLKCLKAIIFIIRMFV